MSASIIKNILRDALPYGIVRKIQENKKNKNARRHYEKNIKFRPPQGIDIEFDDGLFNHISGISFELSNTCNYTKIHPQCPISKYEDKVYLEDDIIAECIEDLALISYKGIILLNRYNEPMIDKERLFKWINTINEKLPYARIDLWTNGTFLYQEDIDKLEECKIWNIHVTAYSVKEYDRLIQLNTKIPYTVDCWDLDDRQDIYTREPINCFKPCYATVRDITINCHGQVSICCLDWDNKAILGDLHEMSLQEIINSDNMLSIHKELTSGNRRLDICKRCDKTR